MKMSWILAQLATRGMTQRDLANKAGMTEQMFTNVVAGRRLLKAREIDNIRRAFGFELPEDRPASIPVVGIVGAGDHVQLADDYAKGAGLFHIARPAWIPAHGVVAAQINGASGEPFALSGDIIFWSRQAITVQDADLGRPVVAELDDGRVMLKRLASGSKPGTWSLLSINPTHPSIFDTPLKWASRVMPPLPLDQVRIVE